MSLNNVTEMGRLTRDPELKRTGSGVSVTRFTIAVDRDYKEQDGTRKADFFDVVAWRKTAEHVAEHFSKGRMIIVVGKLQSRNYTDKNGNNRTAIEIVADSIYFGDNKYKSQSDPTPHPEAYAKENDNEYYDSTFNGFTDADLPY